MEGIKQTYSGRTDTFGHARANQLSEGWAEFFSLFIIDPSAAHQKAPRTVQAFRNMLESADKDMLTALRSGADRLCRLYRIEPGRRRCARARCAPLEKRDGQGFISDIRQRGVSAAMQDRLYALTKNVTDKDIPGSGGLPDVRGREAAWCCQKAGEKLIIKRSIDDPYKLMRMMSQARVHATAALVVMRHPPQRQGVRDMGRQCDVLGQAFGGFTKRPLVG